MHAIEIYNIYNISVISSTQLPEILCKSMMLAFQIVIGTTRNVTFCDDYSVTIIITSPDALFCDDRFCLVTIFSSASWKPIWNRHKLRQRYIVTKDILS